MKRSLRSLWRHSVALALVANAAVACGFVHVVSPSAAGGAQASSADPEAAMRWAEYLRASIRVVAGYALLREPALLDGLAPDSALGELHALEAATKGTAQIAMFADGCGKGISDVAVAADVRPRLLEILANELKPLQPRWDNETFDHRHWCQTVTVDAITKQVQALKTPIVAKLLAQQAAAPTVAPWMNLTWFKVQAGVAQMQQARLAEIDLLCKRENVVCPDATAQVAAPLATAKADIETMAAKSGRWGLRDHDARVESYMRPKVEAAIGVKGFVASGTTTTWDIMRSSVGIITGRRRGLGFIYKIDGANACGGVEISYVEAFDGRNYQPGGMAAAPYRLMLMQCK
ncbi:MAG TPA: hypothetical protein PLF40_04345 [Kofleriaceae bacterium]|nr:hypothetical protein [Kofleriaceae bacterium]